MSPPAHCSHTRSMVYFLTRLPMFTRDPASRWWRSASWQLRASAFITGRHTTTPDSSRSGRMLVCSRSSPMALTAISAILLPIRRPADYAKSTARYSIFGIPAVQIAGVASLFTCSVYFFIVFKYPSVLGTASLTQAWTAVALALGSGFVIFYISRFVRQRQGLRLDTRTEIPPD